MKYKARRKQRETNTGKTMTAYPHVQVSKLPQAQKSLIRNSENPKALKIDILTHATHDAGVRRQLYLVCLCGVLPTNVMWQLLPYIT